jgi:formylmethanofuran dehydrogenase subunit E
MQKPNNLTAAIEYARKLHGHVGPYLVIGLKIGNAAKKALKISETECNLLKAEVNVPLHPPFSCLLDGIQVSSTCTIGNQRLKFRNSQTIRTTFTSQKDDKRVEITLTKQFIERLEQKRKQDKINEAFAWELMELPESQLFKIDLV